MDWLDNHSVNTYNLTIKSQIVNFINRCGMGNEYTGYVKLVYPDTPPNKFIRLLGFTQQNQIIEHTNSFLVDRNFKKNDNGIIEYDKIHRIFSGLDILYNNVEKIQITETINEPMFLLFNTFGGRNAGHDLSILFHRIHIYRERSLQIPVVVGESMLEFPFTLDICKILLPNTSFYILKKNTTVAFNSLMVTQNVIFDIMLHKNLHHEVITWCINNCSDINKYKNKKVCLIKNTAANKNIVSAYTAFTSTELMKILETKYNYIVINPEQMNFIDLVLYLYHATKIVVSYGGIMYTNCIFFNPSATLYYLYTNGNRHEPYYEPNRYINVGVNTAELDTIIDPFLRLINE